MWSVIWKNDKGIYTAFTNVIFETEKKAVEFKRQIKNLCVKNMIAE